MPRSTLPDEIQPQPLPVPRRGRERERTSGEREASVGTISQKHPVSDMLYLEPVRILSYLSSGEPCVSSFNLEDLSSPSRHWKPIRGTNQTLET